MFSNADHQPLYLRSSKVTQASDDDDFWRALQERMASHNENVTSAKVTKEVDGSDRASSWPLPAARRRGGGSWLLGFASLDDTFATQNDGDARAAIPDLVPVPISDSETETESDDDSDRDDDSIFSSSSASEAVEPAKKGVSFSLKVEVKTIPHFSSYSFSERRRMYTSSLETRKNRRRNKKEFRYDGCDWRNVTEECDMGIDEVTGELVHPAHEYEQSRAFYSNETPTIAS